MRAPFLLLALLALPITATAAPAAKADPAKANGPKALGIFDDWQAATYAEGGQTVCYAFTRPKSSTPAVPGRGAVLLTVTQRDKLRDAISLGAGFTYPAKADVKVNADSTELDFYTAKRSAFARDGHAAVIAFQKANQAIAHSPEAKGKPVVDTFSLRGFSAAYAAISKACPPK
ncbi:MAG TPA: invasion associated locus B family protein [Acetobacteraceae bacterium]|jgi:hypothetical protein|nr:invasion associated locus B family protein [Acetobacteraceae bacterium]